jgi:hypothetical protein
MLGKSSLNIGGNAGIERAIRAEDDVDLPVQLRIPFAVDHRVFDEQDIIGQRTMTSGCRHT